LIYSYFTLPDIKERDFLNRYIEIKDDFKLYKGKGCEHCLYTGYKGRIAIYEIMKIDEDFRSIISKSTDSKVIRDYALKKRNEDLNSRWIKKSNRWNNNH